MAQTKIGTLVVDLTSNTAKFQESMKAAARQTETTSRKIGKALAGASKLAAAFGAAMVAAATAGTVAMVKQSLKSVDVLHKLNIRLGASVEALSQYRLAAKLAGVSVETLTMGWQRMTRRVAEAAIGKGEARDALKELNLEAVALSKLRPEDQFRAISKAMGGIKNQADKVRLAMKIFDSEGVSLLQAMGDGANAAMERIRALGLVISKLEAEQIAKLNDAMAETEFIWTSAWEKITAKMAPVMNFWAKEVDAIITKFAKWAVDAIPQFAKNATLIAVSFRGAMTAIKIQLTALTEIFKEKATQFGDILSFAWNLGVKGFKAMVATIKDWMKSLLRYIAIVAVDIGKALKMGIEGGLSLDPEKIKQAWKIGTRDIAFDAPDLSYMDRFEQMIEPDVKEFLTAMDNARAKTEAWADELKNTNVGDIIAGEIRGAMEKFNAAVGAAGASVAAAAANLGPHGNYNLGGGGQPIRVYAPEARNISAGGASDAGADAAYRAYMNEINRKHGGEEVYHTGGIVGMKPNERRARLEVGEEVLTRSDPRHRFNLERAGLAPKAPPAVYIDNRGADASQVEKLRQQVQALGLRWTEMTADRFRMTAEQRRSVLLRV